ncbi:MAG: signal peptide peptidase SppA [Deltaproteobacteria bacterium]|nr:signal peptide peptidase SppA [Nannocystaceae bacterium]
MQAQRQSNSKIRGLAGRVGRMFKWLWKGINSARVATMNLLFVAVVITVVVLILNSEGPDFHDKNALVLAPKGTIVEQLSAEGPSVASLVSGSPPETLLRDLVETIERAGKDPRVTVLVLDCSELQSAGISKLQELGAALTAFKAEGKTVIATADNYSQTAYYLAAHADEVYMHGMGEVGINGLGRYHTYYKDALDRFEIDWHIFRVGKYKSAVEPYLRNSMSDEAREADLAWMGDLWEAYIADVAAARGITPAELLDYATKFDEHVVRANGSSSAAALSAKLVDHVGGRDLVRDRLIELVGEDEKEHSFNRVDGEPYLDYVRQESPKPMTGDKVAVIVARGSIVDGDHPAGVIGGDSTAALIRKARNDEDVKALVLRVDSGGGSAFASEVIRREFELARAAGKPVVVSMGSVAASGGYWISTASDEIWASPTTITGSIGIFGMFPTIDKPLAKHVGIHTDGVATTPFAGVSIERSLDPAVARALQSGIEHGYREFLARVASARNMTSEQVDAIAQGRVWSGVDAHQAGLVDKLGGLQDAIASAAVRAELGDDYRIEFVEKELDLKDRVIKNALGGGAEVAFIPGLAGTPYGEVLRVFEEQARILASFNDPRGVYAYALIDVD